MKAIFLQTGVVILGTLSILGSGGPQYNDITYENNTSSGTSSKVDMPSHVSAVSAYQSVLLTWDEDKDATGFKVCSATADIVNFDQCQNYAAGAVTKVNSGHSLHIKNLSDEELYYFRVVAEDDEGNFSQASAVVTARPSLGLNDTGITVCREAGKVNVTCPSRFYPNQDADKGWDVSAADSTDGHAGFKFIKLDSNGNELPSSAGSWTCVKDQRSGLVWEVKRDDGGVHDANDRFTWYSTDFSTNAGTLGSAAGSTDSCEGYDAAASTSYCNTQAFAKRVNDAKYCGLNNWRMPTRDELVSIVNYGTVNPSADIGFFPLTRSDLYWTATSVYSSTISGDQAWAINFNYGGSSKEDKVKSLRVRLVSDGK
ncbi:MAG: hypothetical protein CSB47_10535 [Proteobacteria bacterium]|nr:MAG: hypothetical protein CSB47_10535 [Pseudomonadota bacterium]